MKNRWKAVSLVGIVTLVVGGVLLLSESVSAADGQATFSGGYTTEPKDSGRPVVLIAAALGVTPDIFREAFRGVTPAKDGKPSREEARRNKEALMKVLRPHGVSNERLDEVSDHYRYRPGSGDLWKHKPAKAKAIIEDGKITQVVVTDAGAGYSTPPKITIKGFEKAEFKVTLLFDKDLTKNGSVLSIEIMKPR